MISLNIIIIIMMMMMRPVKLNEKKGDRDLEREMKNRRRHFFVRRTT